MSAPYESFLKGSDDEINQRLRRAYETSHSGGMQPLMSREGLLAVRALYGRPDPLRSTVHSVYQHGRTLAYKTHRSSREVPATEARRRIVPSSLMAMRLPMINEEPYAPIKITGARTLVGPTGRKVEFDTTGRGDGKLALLNLMLVCASRMPGQPELQKGEIMPGQLLRPLADFLDMDLTALTGMPRNDHAVIIDTHHRKGLVCELDGRVGFVDKR